MLTDERSLAMRDILLRWHELSAGDVSLIVQQVRDPQGQGQVMTLEGTPHAAFWRNVVRLDWAEQLYSPIDPGLLPIEPLSFRLLPGGQRSLAWFLIAYDLLWSGKEKIAMARAFIAEEALGRKRSDERHYWPALSAACVMALSAVAVALLGGGAERTVFLVALSAFAFAMAHVRAPKGRQRRLLYEMAGAGVFLVLLMLGVWR